MIIDGMEQWFLFALVAGCSLMLAAGPLGCFVVWRRMAYFGDTIAHAALLGVTFSLITALPVSLGVLCVSLTVAVLLFTFSADSRFHMDTNLGILAHGMLALSLVILSLIASSQVDMVRYLFGDILALSQFDVVMVAVMSAGLAALVRYHWRPLVIASIHQDIAAIEGVAVKRMQLLLVVMMAAMIAVSIKLVGMLLITALLIIPAATARFFSHSPAQMVVKATLCGMASVLAGLMGSYYADTPAAPTIILVAFVAFLAAWMLQSEGRVG